MWRARFMMNLAVGVVSAWAIAGCEVTPEEMRTDAGPPLSIDGGPSNDASPNDAAPPGDASRPRRDGSLPDPDAGAPGPWVSPGTVTVVDTACDTPGASSCWRLSVECGGLDALEVRVRSYDPTSAPRGTVLFGTGGAGTGFYFRAAETSLRSSLQAAGFRVVERAWDTPGWYTGTPGLRFGACRYATLLGWVHENIAEAQPLCITGNSGGSAEVGYALTRYDAEAIVEQAVPTSGPATTRLDYVCAGQKDDAWLTRCGELIPDGVFDCVDEPGSVEPGGPTCTFAGLAGVCRLSNPDPTLEDMWADSVAAPDADFDYAGTRVDFLYGTRDCDGPNVASALNWATQVTSDHGIEYVPDAPHQMASSETGRDAIFAAIDRGCR